MKKIYLEPILHDNTRIMLSFRPVSVSNMVELSRPIILLHLSAVTCLARAVLRSDGGKRGWRTACRHRMARPSPSRVARLPAAVGRVGWRPWWWWSVGAGTARPRQRERRGVSPPSPSSPTFPLVLVVAFPSPSAASSLLDRSDCCSCSPSLRSIPTDITAGRTTSALPTVRLTHNIYARACLPASPPP
jgi:hypothetical protein